MSFRFNFNVPKFKIKTDQKSQTSQLKHNLRIAKLLCQLTREYVPFSSNRKEKTNKKYFLIEIMRFCQLNFFKKKYSFNLPLFEEIRKWRVSSEPQDPNENKEFFNQKVVIHQPGKINFWSIEQLLQILERSINWLKKQQDYYTNEEFFQKYMALLAIKWRIANCDELTAIAFNLFVELYMGNRHKEMGLPSLDEIDNLKIEKISINRKGDHCFLILGRDPSSDLTDPSTWGENAVVSDPWANTYYSVQEELSKPFHLQKHIFKYILKYAQEMELVVDAQAGQGHPPGWEKYCRENDIKPFILDRRKYQDRKYQEEEIPYVHPKKMENKKYRMN